MNIFLILCIFYGLNIKSDFQAMEINVFSIAKIRIYFETSKFYREIFPSSLVFSKKQNNHQAFSFA